MHDRPVPATRTILQHPVLVSAFSSRVGSNPCLSPESRNNGTRNATETKSTPRSLGRGAGKHYHALEAPLRRQSTMSLMTMTA